MNSGILAKNTVLVPNYVIHSFRNRKQGQKINTTRISVKVQIHSLWFLSPLLPSKQRIERQRPNGEGGQGAKPPDFILMGLG